MKDFTQKLYNELLLKLADLDRSDYRENLADPRLSLICSSIDLIRKKLKLYLFSNDDDEIYYFKSVLPQTLSLLIYYADKIEWDRILLQNSTVAIQEFFERTFNKIKNFRSENKEFFDYCRSGKSHMDSFYFLRNSPMNIETIHQIESVRDPSCPTIHCVLVATFLAHLKQEQEMYIAVTNRKTESTSIENGKSSLKWTGKIVDLIELGIALHEAEAFNNGKVSRKEMFEFFEKAFGVELGNTSRQFQDIRLRKTGNTNYLDLLTQKLRKKIDDMDD
jgi:hypothetical protein